MKRDLWHFHFHRARHRAQSTSTSFGADGAIIDGYAAFAAAAAGDALARQLVTEKAPILGIGIVNLMNRYSQELIILGGAMADFEVLHPP